MTRKLTEFLLESKIDYDLLTWKTDESNDMRIFHLWVLSRMWIHEKLAGLFVFCSLFPDTNEAPPKHLVIINICLTFLQFAKPLPCGVSFGPHDNPGSLQSNFTEVITLETWILKPHFPAVHMPAKPVTLQFRKHNMVSHWLDFVLVVPSAKKVAHPFPVQPRSALFILENPGQAGKGLFPWDTLESGAPKDGAHVRGRPAGQWAQGLSCSWSGCQ